MRNLLWSALLVGSLVLTGCGNDDDNYAAGVFPLAVNDNYQVSSDGILLVDPVRGLLSNDAGIGFDGGQTDPDVRVTVSNAPTRGTVQLEANGGFTYVPAANQQGQIDTFIYVVTNDNGSSAATVTVFIGGPGSATGRQ